MTRRELREEIFKLLFMVEFYSKEEMAEQVKSYFEDFPEKEISEKDHAYIEEKYENICAVLPEIDEKIAGAAKGWTRPWSLPRASARTKVPPLSTVFSENWPDSETAEERLQRRPGK